MSSPSLIMHLFFKTECHQWLKFVSPFLRAKLAGWLASKGKTLKRPPLAKAASSKVSVKSKPEPKVLPQPAELSNTRPCLKAQEPDHGAIATAAPQSAQKQEAAVMTTGQTPAIMNTTLDLLENSDADLPVEPQDKIDDVRKPGYSWSTSPVTLNVNIFL